MVFKNFRFQVFLRVTVLIFCIVALAWCLTNALYLRSFYIAIACLVLTIELIRVNRDIKTFMSTLLQGDFMTHYQESGKGKSFDALYQMLNRISDAFKKINAEKEIQYRYLELLVEHVRVSILSIDADEKIHLANQALRDLLRKKIVTNLKMIESLDETLVRTIREIHAGETRLIKVNIEDELLQISIHASEFKLDGRYFKLISMQNIKNELDSREMESWQKLIRVLSHEIMNSVSPISSLSDTLHGLVRQNRVQLSTMETGLYNSLDSGLEAIKLRSEGLFNFTQTYRKLTHVPKPSLKKTNLKDIIDRVQVLLRSKLAENNIQLKVYNTDVELVADGELMEHVFINLLLNAIDALKNQPEPQIEVYTSRTQKDLLHIHVVDNGEGIDPRTVEKIFIPFFTTRTNGSGIGLALTKQILQLHQANIVLKSQPGKGSEFIIVF
jgi:two-component system nitrogen regulation sensor histidine kinase NtrY